LRVRDLGVYVRGKKALGLWAQGLGFRVPDLGVRVSGIVLRE
jgi:hypothetical protein